MELYYFTAFAKENSRIGLNHLGHRGIQATCAYYFVYVKSFSFSIQVFAFKGSVFLALKYVALNTLRRNSIKRPVLGFCGRNPIKRCFYRARCGTAGTSHRIARTRSTARSASASSSARWKGRRRKKTERRGPATTQERPATPPQHRRRNGTASQLY